MTPKPQLQHLCANRPPHRWTPRLGRIPAECPECHARLHSPNQQDRISWITEDDQQEGTNG